MRSVVCMLVALGCMALAEETNNEVRCSSGYHECYNNTDNCIPNYQVCDGKADCFYGDDELNCASQNTTTTTAEPTSSREPVTCLEGQYLCQVGLCIPDTWVCDGTTDCPYYADDENGCPTSASIPRQAPQADARSREAAARIDCDGYLCFGTLACINETLVCNGVNDCLYGDDEGICNYTKTSTTPIPPQCRDNFDYIYDRCVLVDPFTATTWDEARYLCQLFEGDLVVLDDFNFYEELLQYITDKGLDEHSYWVGATDRALEGVWLWVNVSPVPSGAPLWALYGCTGGYDLEPSPTEADAQDCAFLDKDRGLHMSDGACSDTLAAICHTPAN